MRLYRYLLVLIFILPMQVVSADTNNLVDEELHTALIKTAIHFDAFNQRCRGVSLATNLSRVNRLFIRKYDVTVNNYIKVYLSQDPRDAKVELNQQMIDIIMASGGCNAARQQGVGRDLKAKFRKLSRLVEQSSWIPTRSRER